MASKRNLNRPQLAKSPPTTHYWLCLPKSALLLPPMA